MNYQSQLSPPSPNTSEWSPNRFQNSSSPKPPQAHPGRGNLATPPISGYSSNGMNGPYGNGPNGRLNDYRGNPSPPSSVGRSSYGQGPPGDGRQRRQPTIEEALNTHYAVLKRYLAQTIQQEQQNKHNRARDKLARLSSIQFQELSTDVYDELLRRQAMQGGRGAPDFLPPKQNFHPKRNQARQKLSTLPRDRFRALATDVFFEFEQRFQKAPDGSLIIVSSPRMGSPSRSGTPVGGGLTPRQGSLGGQVLAGSSVPGEDGPMQKSSQSNTIVPNKSYLVEDDDEGDLDSVYGGGKRDTSRTTKSFSAQEKLISEYQTKVEELQGKVSSLEKDLEDRSDEVERVRSDHQESLRSKSNANSEFEKVRRSLEDKLHDAQALNDNLQSEIDKMQAGQRDKERNFQEQLNVMANKSSDGAEWKNRYQDIQQEKDRLQQDNDEIQKDLREQQRLNDEVSRNAARFLAEMKEISERSGGGTQREEQLSLQVRQLQEDLKDWKGRCANLKAQASSRVSTESSVPQPNFGIQGLLQDDGMIRDVCFTSFQMGIDEALTTARASDPRALLEAMKHVALSVKAICEDVPENVGDQQLQKSRGKVVVTTNNFITATKNFVAAQGLSPVSLLDAAASHVSAAVIELARAAKLRPGDGAPAPAKVYEPAQPYEPVQPFEPVKTFEPVKSFEPAQPFEPVQTFEPVKQPDPPKHFSTAARSSMTESVYSNTTFRQSRMNPRSEVTSQYDNDTTYLTPSIYGAPNGQPEIPDTDTNGNSEDSTREILELKNFLVDQKDMFVDDTSTLVTAIRNGAPPDIVLPQLAKISSKIGNILGRTQDMAASNAVLDKSVSPLTRNLEACLTKMENAEDDCRRADGGSDWPACVRKLPPIAFEVARQVRELESRVGDLLGEDDFR